MLLVDGWWKSHTEAELVPARGLEILQYWSESPLIVGLIIIYHI